MRAWEALGSHDLAILHGKQLAEMSGKWWRFTTDTTTSESPSSRACVATYAAALIAGAAAVAAWRIAG